MRYLYFIMFCMAFGLVFANDDSMEVSKALSEDELVRVGSALEIELPPNYVSRERRQEVVFESVLDLVRNEKVEKIQQIGPYLGGLENYQGDSVLTSLVRSNDVQTIQKSINNGIIQYLYNNESELLHVAVQDGGPEVIGVLYHNGLAEIDQLNREGKAPIHVAIEFNKNDLLRALIGNGAATTIAYTIPGTKTTYSPLAYAVKFGNTEAFDILIENVDISISTLVEDIGNLLHIAVQFAQHDMLQHILQKYNSEAKHLLELSTGINKTPLMLAASLEDIDSISLLYKNGAALETVNSNGRTAMHFAAEFCKKDSIHLLHYFGANLQAFDTRGEIPFSLLREAKDFYCTTTRNLLLSLSKQKTATAKKPPDFSYQLPHNLVFKGGGAKGIAYLGAVKRLEETNKMREVRRIAGTSAGAITATLLAFGYSVNEIDDLLSETSLTSFLDYPELKVETIKKGILENINLSMMWDAFNYLKNPVEAIKNISPTNLFRTLTKVTGICKGEVFREWIEKQIEEKTGIK